MDTLADFWRGCFLFILGFAGASVLWNWDKIFDWWLDWVFGKTEDKDE